MRIKERTNLLVTLADKNYIDQAKQLFSSVYFNAGWKGDYMLLVHEIPENKLKWFRDKGILIKKCKPLYNKVINDYPPLLFDKFYLFTPEFKKWKNIVYLDADISVRASLNKLATVKGFNAVPLFKKYGGFENIISLDYIDKKKDDILFRLMEKYDFKRQTFNAGVMAFSSDILTKNTFFDLISLFNKYKSILITADEVIFNMYYYNTWVALSPAYNVILRDLKNPYRVNAVVLHFGGKIKPWNKEKKNIFYQEWKNNLERAELIDFKNIPLPAKVWTDEEINKSPESLGLTLPRPHFSIDKLVGKFGILLRKYYPMIYIKLKKLNGYFKA